MGKAIEYSSEYWDNISQKHFLAGAALPIAFKMAWEDLLESNDPDSNIISQLLWDGGSNYSEKLAILYQLLQPHFEKSLLSAVNDDDGFFDSYKFDINLTASIKNSPELSKICEKIIELQWFYTGNQDPQSLLENFLVIFNFHFLNRASQYVEDCVVRAEYPLLEKMQPYKLHLSLPLETDFECSENAAKRIYALLKSAIEQGVLHAAKVLKGLELDAARVDVTSRHFRYSQFTLYLPDPLDIENLKKLIAQINLIAKEEGVYHCDYEAKCDTHISGIVSLRNDYIKGGQYKAAEEFTPEDLEEQNKLPIIQQLATPDTHEEKKHEPFPVHRCTINKTKLHDFYLEVKGSMTKTSKDGEKGATYNHLDEIFQRERLTHNETKQSLKLLLKIILQCNDSKYFLTTTSGGRALKLLNSENFSLLKQIITSEKRALNYEDLARFAREENDKKPLSFFATKNKEANMKAFNTEIDQLKDVQKSHFKVVG